MDDTISSSGSSLTGWLDFFIVLGAMLLVALAVLVWALVFRKRGRSPRRRHHPHPPESDREEIRKDADDLKEPVRRRRRRRRHEHRPLNPTLAETGGLPPIRETEAPPAPSPQP